MVMQRHIQRRSVLVLALAIVCMMPTAALAMSNTMHSTVSSSFVGGENPFLPSCEASPVQEVTEEEEKKGKQEEGTPLFLSTRCTATGTTAFWRCMERKELGTILIDCTEERTDGVEGRKTRITQTARSRLGAVLCGIVCR